MDILVFVSSIIVSYLLTYPVIHFAKKMLLVTDISRRPHPAHTHKGVIPRAGGVPVYLSVLVVSILFLPISRILTAILFGSGMLVIIGLLDDYRDMSPYLRFGLNILVAAVVVSAGIGIPYISNPFGGVIMLNQWKFNLDFFGHHSILIGADLLSILWLTWTMNMINWSKGVDGQLPGFVAITAFFLALLSQRFTAHDISVQSVVLLSLIISGAFLGFLPHNFYPQKIMPGYGGGSLAGFLLGVLSILSFGKLGTAILILSIPMIDASYVIVRRIKENKSPFNADWGHFHHRLLEIGWGRRRVAVFYWIISLMLGISSLFLDGVKKFIAFITVCVFLIFFLMIIDRMKKDIRT